ncbi:hypothetical protein H696_03430 [Fonticula alba]|uniref:VTT domain-containing protein n=1 Tax=Fonticula alba TaxID=691883 RepID=A0A058Z6V8_FONAL|nr:hypothetical protein H696_03430 [Fonticula alba]KCV69965.1 hypothetical protein H696_03430 [Fonticula alba]|eukprot:XP_009495571.1 hypothetical protein H696_03430 [Fonticula alba]
MASPSTGPTVDASAPPSSRAAVLRDAVLLLILLAAGLAVVALSIRALPDFSPTEADQLGIQDLRVRLFLKDRSTRLLSWLPWWVSFDSLMHLRMLSSSGRLGPILGHYIATNYGSVVSAYMALYIFLQTFAIPGSAGLSVIGGALFGFWPGLLLVCLCSALGATGCYLLSRLLGRHVLSRFSGPPLTTVIAGTIHDLSGGMVSADAWDRSLWVGLAAVLLLRISPVPNFLVNVASPHAGLRLVPFFLGTFFGVIPLSLVPVQTGAAVTSPTLAIALRRSGAVLAVALVFALLVAWVRKGPRTSAPQPGPAVAGSPSSAMPADHRPKTE